MAKQAKPKIKNESQYEALREQGMSKEKAARIANTDRPEFNSTPYEYCTKSALYEQAKKVDIPGRSRMTKEELIQALRNH
ncbi:DUF7218 family protein [Pararhodonellum marinum]|uniref:DUF7218 family protein n=1 Tax=Pararhodonellum marinum TaxID=2755358 RepID=UPI0018905D87|nr:Rho termination factor N-terminal domain-containing protein [Pararhodonellum marinum]